VGDIEPFTDFLAALVEIALLKSLNLEIHGFQGSKEID